jgi:hypothetical protein
VRGPANSRVIGGRPPRCVFERGPPWRCKAGNLPCLMSSRLSDQSTIRPQRATARCGACTPSSWH